MLVRGVAEAGGGEGVGAADGWCGCPGVVGEWVAGGPHRYIQAPLLHAAFILVSS